MCQVYGQTLLLQILQILQIGILHISQLQLHLLHWQSSNGFKILPSVWNGTKLPSSDSCKCMLKKTRFPEIHLLATSKHIFLYSCKIHTARKDLSLIFLQFILLVLVNFLLIPRGLFDTELNNWFPYCFLNPGGFFVCVYVFFSLLIQYTGTDHADEVATV